jgi:HTH-type transcriptional regulator/antitoxin HigA
VEEEALNMRRLKTISNAKDTYLELVKRFPLRSIKSRSEHQAALKMLSKLAISGVEDDDGSLAYMETLAQLIDDYEKGAGMKLDLRGATPLRALKHLMEVHGLTVTSLGKIVGSQGTLSDVIAGRRELSKSMIRKLADHFGVSAAVFL